jgi:hypothetical protein
MLSRRTVLAIHDPANKFGRHYTKSVLHHIEKRATTNQHSTPLLQWRELHPWKAVRHGIFTTRTFRLLTSTRSVRIRLYVHMHPS